MSDTATCRNPKPSWQLNSMSQDACEQYTALIRLCDSTFTLHPLDTSNGTTATTTYKPPSNECGCNLLAYNLQAACVWCQGALWLSPEAWQTACTVNGQSYFNGIPTAQQANGIEGIESLDIPAWAQVYNWTLPQAIGAANSTPTTNSNDGPFVPGGTPSHRNHPIAGWIIGISFLVLISIALVGFLLTATHRIWAGARPYLSKPHFQRPFDLSFQRPIRRGRGPQSPSSSSGGNTLMSGVATGATITGIALMYNPEDPKTGKRVVPLPYTPTISIDEQKIEPKQEERMKMVLEGRLARSSTSTSINSLGADPGPGPSPPVWSQSLTRHPPPSRHRSLYYSQVDKSDKLSRSKTTKASHIISGVNNSHGQGPSGRKESEDSFASHSTLVNSTFSSPISVRTSDLRQPATCEQKPQLRHHSLDQVGAKTTHVLNLSRSASLSAVPVSIKSTDHPNAEQKRQSVISTTASTVIDSPADRIKPPPSSFSKWGNKNPYLGLSRHDSLPYKGGKGLATIESSPSPILHIKKLHTTFRIHDGLQESSPCSAMTPVEKTLSSTGGSSTPSSTPPPSSSPTTTSSPLSSSSSPSSSSILDRSHRLPHSPCEPSIEKAPLAKSEETRLSLARSNTARSNTVEIRNQSSFKTENGPPLSPDQELP